MPEETPNIDPACFQQLDLAQLHRAHATEWRIPILQCSQPIADSWRWMRLITIPHQSSVAKAFTEFDDKDRMKPSSYYDPIVDVMEELVKFTYLTRDRSSYLVDRYSERKQSAAELSKSVSQRSI